MKSLTQTSQLVEEANTLNCSSAEVSGACPTLGATSANVIRVSTQWGPPPSQFYLRAAGLQASLGSLPP